ncbi:AAA family ATPase [Curtobacterium sp. MCSS17_015]|uniref:AAA family ATPase n=1 Tax=Curtobacterium sp. MCSS17_015 TaxID=2175666 RepID=UPI000DAA78B5|nr:AAA family ATPase [Curtobacterium sp. MCSS17_015]WIB25859.1 AAA family ATPase [Curtobacterium sp. MCSS17_015]
MKQLIITRGIPASGKSTWAKEWVAEDPDHRVRVNRDELRHMLFNKWHGVNEDVVTSVERAAVIAAIRSGQSVVVDATHLHPRSLRPWLDMADRFSALFVVRDFDVPDEEAIERDANRAKPVGGDVIRIMREKRNRLQIS